MSLPHSNGASHPQASAGQGSQHPLWQCHCGLTFHRTEAEWAKPLPCRCHFCGFGIGCSPVRPDFFRRAVQAPHGWQATSAVQRWEKQITQWVMTLPSPLLRDILTARAGDEIDLTTHPFPVAPFAGLRDSLGRETTTQILRGLLAESWEIRGYETPREWHVPRRCSSCRRHWITDLQARVGGLCWACLESPDPCEDPAGEVLDLRALLAARVLGEEVQRG